MSLDLTTPLMGTKAYADGQTVDVVHVHVYQQDSERNLTYIAPNATTATPSKDVTMTGGTASYSTRLVTGQTYTFVFWAQDKDVSYYTYDADTQTISVDYSNAAGNDESRDAFYAVLPNVTITGAYSASVELYRPFAQLNFGASDYDAAKAAGIEVTGAAVKLTNVANSLNLLTGDVTGNETVTFENAAISTIPNGTLTAAGVGYKYVAMDYVLVGKDAKTLSDVTLTLAADGTLSATPEYTYTSVPLQGNYRTNIVGSLFTSPADITITVNPAFKTPDENIVAQNVASIAAANEALSNGATSVTIANVTASETVNTKLEMPATSENITVTVENIESTANLQIEKPATGSNPESVSVVLPASASVSNLTINLPDSHVEVNGATYNSITATTSNNTLVIGSDVKVTTLTIEAGAVEIYGEVGTLTNNGTGAVKVWAVGNEETWNKAYNAGAQTIELKNSFNVNNTIEIGRSLDIQGNGFEISHGTGSAQNSRVVNINGLNNQEYNFYNTIFSEKSTGAYSRGINVWGEASGSKITLDGCTVSAGFYALNFIIGPSDIEFTIKNGTVAAGWAAINCYANNSTFTVENSTLKGLNDKGESSWNDFSTIVFDGNGLWDAANIGVNGTGNKLNVVNSTIYASSESSNNQSWLALQYGAQRNIVKVDAATRIIDNAGNDQTSNVALENYVGYNASAGTATLYDLESEIWIGGSFVYPGYAASIGSTYYKTLAEAISATSGDVTVVLEPGDHILPTNLAGRSIILEGSNPETTVIDMSAGGTPQYGATSVTFKNVTVKRKSDPYGGLSHCGEEHYVNSKVEGTLVTYAPVVTAVNTEFYQTSSDKYNIHIYGEGSVNLEKCKFNCMGKSIYAHSERASEHNISIKDCEFTANQMVLGKAAIQLHTELGIYGTLDITNCTATGFDSSINGGLWNELNNSTKEVTNNFVKTVNGVQQN